MLIIEQKEIEKNKNVDKWKTHDTIISNAIRLLYIPKKSGGFYREIWNKNIYFIFNDFFYI